MYINTIHYVAPQVWVWRKNRVKKIKKFIDHILLLFDFEKKYFDEENIKNTFVGHPLIEKKDNVITTLDNLISKDKKIISLFPGSRKSETNVLLPILLNFIKLMNNKNLNHSFVFNATDENKKFVAVDVKALKKLNKPVTLEQIKINKHLKNIALLKQSRLSVMPLLRKEFEEIIKLSKRNE